MWHIWFYYSEQYLIKSVFVNFCRLKQRQEEENIRYQDNMQKKMDMLLKLKNDIQANRVRT